MTTYNTGNPIGSKDPRDLYDNAENLDEVVNTRQAESWDDRFGVARKTWWGMERDFSDSQTQRENDFSASQIDKQNRFNNFIASSGYQFLGDYAAGIEITEYNQIIRDSDGEFWRLSGEVDLPYTTTGDWGTEGDNFVSVGDASLRQELAGTEGADLIPTVSKNLSSIDELRSNSRNGNPWAFVAGYYAEGDGGGGLYYLDSSDNASLDNGGTIIVAIDGGRWKLNHNGTVSVEQFGADGNGLIDSSNQINSALSTGLTIVAGKSREFLVSNPIYVPRGSRIDFNKSSIIVPEGGEGLVLDNCVASIIRNIRIYLNNNATALTITSSNEALTSSQYNQFYGVDVEGSGNPGTTSVILGKCWSNQFYSCYFNRTFTGITFGIGEGENACNANHFYGCEVRGIDPKPTDSIAVIHGSGDNNGFFGGIIEVWHHGVDVLGGTFFLRGVYLESFVAGRPFRLIGGELLMDGCFREFASLILGGRKYTLTNHQFTEPRPVPTFTPSWPAIRVDGNVDTLISVDVQSRPDEFFIIREGEYYDAGSWVRRTNGVDQIRWVDPKFSIRLSANRLDVTGDGTAYRVDFGNNKEFDNWQATNNSGRFFAPVNGFYRFDTNLRLGGLQAGHRVTVRIKTFDREYNVFYMNVPESVVTWDGIMNIGGSCFAWLREGHYAEVELIVQGGSKTVSVLLDGVTNAHSSFSGFKV